MGVKRKAFSKEKRIQIYNLFNGHCAYCGNKISYSEMQVDHVLAVERGGTNDDSNLVPSCRMCNFYKSTYLLEDFRTQLTLLSGRLEKQYIYRLSKKYSLIKETPHDIKFYFEEFPNNTIKEN